MADNHRVETEGFNVRAAEQATLENGDVATGEWRMEDGVMWWRVRDPNGNTYETVETPCIRIDIRSMTYAYLTKAELTGDERTLRNALERFLSSPVQSEPEEYWSQYIDEFPNEEQPSDMTE